MELAWHACPAPGSGLKRTCTGADCASKRCHRGSSSVGVSETVLAAMIGAGATVFTALFQIITSFRSASADRRTAKRGGFRSLMWTLAMILAAGVGGFAYSEYRSLQARDETHALRTELQSQLQ